jgi:hypothetical protein
MLLNKVFQIDGSRFSNSLINLPLGGNNGLASILRLVSHAKHTQNIISKKYSVNSGQTNT